MKMPYVLHDILWCVLIVLVGVAAIWLLFSVGSLFGPDRGSWNKEVIDWDYGSIKLELDENANPKVEYESSFNSLYTRDVIPCSGYQLTVSFPAGVKLDVYYFDAEDNYLEVKHIRDERFVKLVGDQLPEDAAGIRLCMIPDGGNDIFKMPLLSVGNFAQKAKYSTYVTLEITNSDKVTINNVDGI